MLGGDGGYLFSWWDGEQERFYSYQELLDQNSLPEIFLRSTVGGDDFFETLTEFFKALVGGKSLTLLSPKMVNAKNQIDSDVQQWSSHKGKAFSDIQDMISQSMALESFSVKVYSTNCGGEYCATAHSLESLSTLNEIQFNTGPECPIVWGIGLNPSWVGTLEVLVEVFRRRGMLVNLLGRSPTQVLRILRDMEIPIISVTPSVLRQWLPFEPPIATVHDIFISGEVADDSIFALARRAFPSAKIHHLFTLSEAGSVFWSNQHYFLADDGLNEKWRIHGGDLEIHQSCCGDNKFFESGREWYPTGDIVRWVSDQRPAFHIVGKSTTEVKIGGITVYTSKVAKTIESFYGVRASRVFCIPNSAIGSTLVAEVVPSIQMSEGELREFLNNKLSTIEIPTKFFFVDKLSQNELPPPDLSEIIKSANSKEGEKNV